MAKTLLSRKDAIAQGLTRYYTGKPCKRGHTAERYVCNLECAACVYDKTKARAWHKHNRERHNELGKESYQRNKEARAANRRQWTADNPDYFRKHWHARPEAERKAKKRAWYQANREHAIAYTAQWVLDHPEEARALKAVVSHRRREREQNAGGDYTAADLVEILEAQGHRCAYCRICLRKAKRHLDHIMPLALGGSNDRTNVIWSCAPCNLAKGAKDPLQFAQERGRLL